jgi:septal ring factor EnvC (AmiA/AmiB activator)
MLIVIQTTFFLAALALMTGYALRLSRRTVQLTRRLNSTLTDLTAQRHAVNEWREQARMLRRRSERSERVLESVEAQLEDVTDERNGVIAELGQARADLIRAIEDRNCATDIATGVTEENAAYKSELRALREKVGMRAVAN